MAIKTYDSSQVSVILGTTIITDFESVGVEKIEDKWSFTSGSSGESTRSKNSNKLGSIPLVIPQTSSANLNLSLLAEADALIPVLIQDNNGNSIHSMPQGTIQKIATADYAKDESGTREWVIMGDLEVNVVGGN